jgi:peptidoglycan hydrolase CwlO-like protein
MTENKKTFWNNWDFRSILQLTIIVIGFIVTFTRLDARVDSDKKENVIELNHLKERVLRLEKSLEKIDDKLDDILTEMKTKKNK